jgi:hypothetical protein
LAAFGAATGGEAFSERDPLRLASAGSHQLLLLTPDTLELTRVTERKQSGTSPDTWDFVDKEGRCQLPNPTHFLVTAGGKQIPVQAVGFKRRVLYAPLKQWDLRVANHLYLRLQSQIPDGAQVEVREASPKLWRGPYQFSAKATASRWSPVVHVNQNGYLPHESKQAMVGYYLGNLGELELVPPTGGQGTRPAKAPARAKQPPAAHSPGLTFTLTEAKSYREVFRGALKIRPDKGFPFPCYQQVWEADFSAFRTPGRYRVQVPGVGVSFPFVIDEGVAAAFARTYALGIYHQRCGMSNQLPFTRFSHAECHLAPAAVPDMSRTFESANASLTKESANAKEDAQHVAPPLKDMAASLYPFVNRGPVNVRGGHHDAGDYSKYTINSAAFIHHLVFAADTFPGAGELDNLGLPESGDGKSDLLQEAKWEADFLARMQDADGGFYFLVYPRDREYENDVLPDRGDPQLVFPKNTAATAAACAALAQCASSPRFKAQFPDAAQTYLKQAKSAWRFLQQAIARHGQQGAYQKITHYGNQFMHDDELAWAACELFLATGDESYEKPLNEWLRPDDPATRRWGWWRLFDAYGCAIRSYAFGAQTGRRPREELNQALLEACEKEVEAAGRDQLRRAQESAYGTSFPEETKRTRTAGWYFSSDAAFDLAAAYQLPYPSKRDPRPELLEALLGNLNYEAGCNPVNVTYLTGTGWKRQREIVHQFALNDHRTLPPTGIPIGNLQAGFGWNYVYEKVLDPLNFPADGAEDSPYPFYDRWGDGFNLSQEFVIVNQARALGYLAWLMARTSLKTQAWRSATAQIDGLPGDPAKPAALTLRLTSPGLDLSAARIVWETNDREPWLGQEYPFTPGPKGLEWVEAEAELPDGRRLFASWSARQKGRN